MGRMNNKDTVNTRAQKSTSSLQALECPICSLYTLFHFQKIYSCKLWCSLVIKATLCILTFLLEINKIEIINYGKPIVYFKVDKMDLMENCTPFCFMFTLYP